ncbi:hypothetical protein [Actinophytocola sp. KF-1]
MAFPLDYGQLRSERVAVPAPPRIARACRRRVWRRLVVGGLLCLAGGVTAGFATPFEPHWLDDGEPARYVLSTVALLLCVMQGLIAMEGNGRDMARVFGYGQRGWGAAAVWLIGPQGTIATCVAALSGGLGIGLVGAVGIRLALGEPATAVVAVLAADAGVFAWAFARARRAWARQRTEHAERQRILADGVHVVARVGSVRPQEQWIDAMAVFLVDLDFDYRGEPVVRQLYLHDFPVWAPEEGNEFDLWIDPADPARVLVERRYVDQRFAGPPERFRRPETADNPPGALAPAWAAWTNGRVPGKRTAAWPTLGALVASAAAGIVPAEVDVPWWTVAALTAHATSSVVNAVVAWRFVVLGRRFVRAGHTFQLTRARSYAGVAVAFLGTLLAPGMVLHPLMGTAPWTPGQATAAATVLFGLLLLPWPTAAEGLVREINGPAPVELVREALTAHDDRRIDELEQDHGFTVSVFLVPE